MTSLQVGKHAVNLHDITIMTSLPVCDYVMTSLPVPCRQYILLLGQRKTDKTDKEDKRVENMKPPNASKQFDKLKYRVRGNCMNDKPHRQDPG